MLECFQKNLRKCKLATELAIQTFCTSNYDIAFFQEPYNSPNLFKNTNLYQCHKGEYYHPPANNARYTHEGYFIITLIKNYLISTQVFKDYYIAETNVKCNAGEITVINVYVPPTRSLHMTLVHLQLTLSSKKTKYQLICGDLNARARLWGDYLTSHRGGEVIDFLSSNNLFILNEGDTPTYQSSTGASNIDISFISKSLTVFNNTWELLDTFDGSDHRSIALSIGIERAERPSKKVLYISQNTDQLLESFCREWTPYSQDSNYSIDEYINNLTNNVQGTLIWKEKTVKRFKSFPWWNTQIRTVRNHCRALRRRYQSTLSLVNQPLRLELRGLYLEKKKELKKLIKYEKSSSWRNFIRENSEAWGKAFKSVFHQKYIDYTLSDSVDKVTLINDLFPSRTVRNWETDWATHKEDKIEISMREVDNALHYSPKGKAPGMDGIPSHIWKKVHKYNPHILHSLFNDIFSRDYFPHTWKTAKLVLIPKGNTSNMEETTYRPISLLPTISKLYERILLNRLNYFIDELMDKRQFGFRRCKGTIDALERLFNHHRTKRGPLNNPAKNQFCCLFLDIKGAFDNYNPLYCLQNLNSLGCPGNYIEILKHFLSSRTINLDGSTKINENGSPQGSCLSPLLWNLIVEGLFKTIKDTDTTLTQAFADDIVIYVHHLDYNRVNGIMKNICASLNLWAREAGITFSIAKCCFISSHEDIRVALQGNNIQRVFKQKYLGVTINQFFSPKEHIQNIRDKSRNLTLKLSQIYHRTWGISNLNAKKIYLGVIEPVLLYGSSAWYDGTVKMDAKLSSAQRAPLLKICNAFKTVSTEAIQILTGILPLDLRIRELKAYRQFRTNGKYDIPKLVNIHPGVTILEKSDETPNYRLNNIFTDGSKSAEGCAAAMVHLDKTSVINISKIKISSNAEIFECELQGILLAIKYMTRSNLNCTIFTDNQSAISCLINDQPKGLTARKILHEASQLNFVTRIAWIKGHSGDTGNELADQHAKLATRETILESSPSSLCKLKNHLKAQSMFHWKERWKNSLNGRTLFQFIPDPSKTIILTDFYVNQFLTGHGYFPAYLKRFHLRNIDCKCNLSNNECNAAHYINDCPAYLKTSREYFLDSSWANKKYVFQTLAKKLEKLYSTKIH
jgi:ribonuclease HI